MTVPVGSDQEKMAEVEMQPPNVEEFVNSGRTGRRNALPDILGADATVGTGDLAMNLEKLCCSPSGASAESSGGSTDIGPSTSQSKQGSGGAPS